MEPVLAEVRLDKRLVEPVVRRPELGAIELRPGEDVDVARERTHDPLAARALLDLFHQAALDRVGLAASVLHRLGKALQFLVELVERLRSLCRLPLQVPQLRSPLIVAQARRPVPRLLGEWLAVGPEVQLLLAAPRRDQEGPLAARL